LGGKEGKRETGTRIGNLNVSILRTKMRGKKGQKVVERDKKKACPGGGRGEISEKRAMSSRGGFLFRMLISYREVRLMKLPKDRPQRRICGGAEPGRRGGGKLRKQEREGSRRGNF